MGAERRARESAAVRYRPRRPSDSVLYRCVQEHLEIRLAQCRDGHDDEWSVPEHVEYEFRRYLECGVLAHGFARARCGDCSHNFLIAFSCKGRGVCPLCNGRRMVVAVNEVGVPMDCSHTGCRASLEIMGASAQPVIFSHSNPLAPVDHGRNVTAGGPSR